MFKLITAVLLAIIFFGSSASAEDARVIASVDLSTQTMTVAVDGNIVAEWPVSSGKSGFETQPGSFRAKSLSRDHKSRQFQNAPMPFAVFFDGGKAIHATNSTKAEADLGTPQSHGCVRLAPENAKAFFELAEEVGIGSVRVVVFNGNRPEVQLSALDAELY